MNTNHADTPGIESIMLADDGVFPNNPKLPLLIYPQVVAPDPALPGDAFWHRFKVNGWTRIWQDGIYPFHHYHSTAHEVLGVCSGAAMVQFGGPNGETRRLAVGDVALLPAGTAHKCLHASPDFAVVGAYQSHSHVDMCYGKTDERPEADRNIASLGRPRTDPVLGDSGGLLDLW